MEAALLMAGKAARAGALFLAFDLLHVRGVPAAPLSCLLLALAAAMAALAARPSLRVSAAAAMHAALLAVGALCFHTGLAHFGPLK